MRTNYATKKKFELVNLEKGIVTPSRKEIKIEGIFELFNPKKGILVPSAGVTSEDVGGVSFFGAGVKKVVPKIEIYKGTVEFSPTSRVKFKYCSYSL